MTDRQEPSETSGTELSVRCPKCEVDVPVPVEWQTPTIPPMVPKLPTPLLLSEIGHKCDLVERWWPRMALRPKVYLSSRTKGYELRHDDGYQVATLSAMDAAKLLFQIKDELRRTSLGRGCVDAVAERRRRNGVD